MNKFVWIGLFLGTTIGGFIPVLWGANPFSWSATILSAIGGAVGLWLGFKIDQSF
jgi:hypothetical protein